MLDACVLVPMPLADTQLRLAALGMFAPKWTGAILAEVSRTLVDKFGLTRDQVARREDALMRHFAGSWIEGCEGLVPSMPNDPGDRHVLAAAVHAGAGLIVTSNLRHFPADVLAPFGVVAQRPGDFLLELYRRQAPTVLASLMDQAGAIGTTPMYLLRRLGVNAPEFVAGLANDLGAAPNDFTVF